MINQYHEKVDWKLLQIREFCETQSGGTPSTTKKEFWNGKIPWINSGELKDCTISKPSKYITMLGLENSSAKLLPRNTVVIALTGATTAKMGLLDIETSTNQSVTGILPNEKFVSKFLFYQLISLRKQILSNSIGTAQPHINKRIVDEIQVRVPPVTEQSKIVAKIEELFSDLDKAVESLKKAKAQLKTYRQAVLKYAFEGRLTHKNIKPGQLPEGWKWVRLGDVSETISGYAFKSKDFRPKGKYQVIRMGNIRPGILRLNEKAVFIDKFEPKIEKFLIKDQDVVMTLTGTWKKRDYGYSVVVNHSENLILNQRLAILRFNEGYLPRFFHYFSRTDRFLDQFFQYETGNVGQGNVSAKAITEANIPFASLAIQAEVVQQIEKRLSEADYMEKTIIQSIDKADATRKSILKKAFEGRLV